MSQPKVPAKIEQPIAPMLTIDEFAKRFIEPALIAEFGPNYCDYLDDDDC